MVEFIQPLSSLEPTRFIRMRADVDSCTGAEFFILRPTLVFCEEESDLQFNIGALVQCLFDKHKRTILSKTTYGVPVCNEKAL